MDLDLIVALLHHILGIEAGGGPDAADEGGGPGAGAAGRAAGEEGGGGGGEALGRWQEVVDQESGDVYFWDPVTNETTWERPPDATQAFGAAAAAGRGGSGGGKRANAKGPPAAAAFGAGAVLVFLPGWHEISTLRDLLAADGTFGDPRRAVVLPLHSGVPIAEQRRVFQRPPPGCVKVVLATNIAETSLTIDDVSYVVDSGRSKDKGYEPLVFSSLVVFSVHVILLYNLFLKGRKNPFLFC